MGDYRVDSDALTAMGFALADLVGAGPQGALGGAGADSASGAASGGSGSGSDRVDAALDDSATAFAVGWGDAAESVVALAVGAVEAADVYRASDESVARTAEAAS